MCVHRVYIIYISIYCFVEAVCSPRGDTKLESSDSKKQGRACEWRESRVEVEARRLPTLYEKERKRKETRGLARDRRTRERDRRALECIKVLHPHNLHIGDNKKERRFGCVSRRRQEIARCVLE